MASLLTAICVFVQASAVCQLTAERPFPTVDLFMSAQQSVNARNLPLAFPLTPPFSFCCAYPRRVQSGHPSGVDEPEEGAAQMSLITSHPACSAAADRACLALTRGLACVCAVCSVAEWCVLVSALHVEAKGIRPYCHAVLYDEYCTFRAKHSASTIEVFPAALFLASFERLLARGVLVLERGTQGAVDCGLCLPSLVDRQFMSVRRGAGKDELEDCLSGNEVVLPQWLKTWALKERTE